MTTRRVLCPIFVVGALVATSNPASAYQRPGRIAAVSVSTDGTHGSGGSGNPAMSANGRWVTFMSEAPDLVPGDTNVSIDVFLHDRVTRKLVLVSRSMGGGPGNSHSLDPAISSDGRWITFSSFSTDLVTGDTTGAPDIFVFDRETETMDRVSLSSTGSQANGPSSYPSISADGRFVSFASKATNLVAGDTNGMDDVFVRDREQGTTERISVSVSGGQGNGHSNFGRISADGSAVAFQSYATNLVSEDTNAVSDIFVRDRAARTTERVSVSSDETQTAGSSSYPTLSGDGRLVSFYSYGADLVPADGNAAADAFVRDRAAGTTRRVSVTSDGVEATGSSSFPAIGEGGRFVVFESNAGNLASGDSNGTYDVFVHDLLDGSTELASRNEQGSGNNESSWPSISGDGRHVAFQSAASNLAGTDANGFYDIYRRDRGPSLGVGEAVVDPIGGGLRLSGWASFSGVRSASVADPSDDGATGALQAGGELTAAAVLHRPELGDVLVRLSVSALPGMRGGFSQVGFVAGARPGVAGAPAVVYGFAFQAASVRYEARALRAAATTIPPSAPLFALFRCETVCTEAGRLSGSIGSAGSDVTIAIPLSLVGQPSALSTLRAFTAFGEAAPGGVVALDEAALGSAILERPSVEVALTDGSSEPGDWAASPLGDGRFEVTLDDVGDARVWIRACLGSACEITVVPAGS